MKRYILHSPFSIYHFEADTWAHSVHKHTYFEIIFIVKGNGTHYINGNAFRYEDGDVFLLGPEDYHHFQIDQPTEFSFVRFNESIHKQLPTDKDHPWQPVIRALLGTSAQSRGSIVTDKQEKLKLHNLLAVLEAESAEEQSQYYEIVRDSLIRSMLVILARNLFGQTGNRPVLKDSIEAILLHIRQHIYEPEEVTIGRLAETFHYAPSYISILFKKHTGESIKQYVIKHRIKLIEARLLYSQLSLSELADEFGYTDESHLCRQFKKYTGTTPIAMRQKA